MTLFCANADAEEVHYLDLAEQGSNDPTPFIRYLEDKNDALSLDDVRSTPFKKLPNDVLDFGYTPSKFWLRFGIRNNSLQVRNLILRTSSRFMRPLEIYRSDEEGNFKRILYNDEHSIFGERPGGMRHLGVELEFQENSQTEIYIHFGAGGRAALSLALTSKEKVVAEQSTSTAWMLIFIAIVGTLALSNLFYFFAFRTWAFLLYVCQETAFVVYAAHMEGFTFQYLWPNSPSFNANASPVLGGLCLFFSMWFCISFLRSKLYTPKYYRVLIAVLILAGIYVLASIVAVSRITNQLGFYLTIIMCVTFFSNAIYIRIQGHVASSYYIAGWFFVYLFVGHYSATMMGLFPLPIDPFVAMKFGITSEAIIFSIGLIDQYRRLNNDYRKTQRELVEQLNSRLTEARERVRLEQDKALALNQVFEKSKTMANTSHDIAQPIRSLRLALGSVLANIKNTEVLESVTGTLDDMESVITHALGEASDALESAGKQVQINVESLLNEVAMRFQGEIIEKALYIRVQAPPLTIAISELALKRCISNLVSNAINNTDKGGLLIAARKRQTDLLIQVYDTGRGIDNIDKERVMTLHEKGQDSLGHGLGLAIVQEICAESGWIFSLRSTPNKGSCFSIRLPGVLA